MKIIQSFWTGNNDPTIFAYGWLSPMDHLLSWILSCNQLRRFYDDVILITDKKGYDILIDKLKLPYTDVVVCLDELSCYNPNMWALAKIKAYSIMDEPFIHVDGDVFIWEKIDTPLHGNDLIVQNKETTSSYYRDMWKAIRPSLDYIPEPMKAFDEHKKDAAFNMGIFGGYDLEFIKTYCSESFKFVDNNLIKVNKLENINFNIFFEQVLLHKLVSQYNKKVGSYIKEDIGDNQYCNFANFDEVPDTRKYLHLLGFYKQLKPVSMKLRTFVMRNYPTYYCRLQNFLNIHPSIIEIGLPCTNEKMEALIVNYMNNYDICRKINYSSKDILLRDMLSTNSIKYLQKGLASQKNFLIKSTFGFKKNDDQIEIQNLDKTLSINSLMIDNVIFSIINDTCDRYQFNRISLTYLDEDFPEEEKSNYLHTLWKRIEMLTSYGLFVYFDIK